MSIYTERTLALLRAGGWECQVVEKWQAFAKKRIDLFGIIDIVAVCPGKILGVQSTSYGQRKKHMDKIMAEARTKKWLDAGGLLWLVSWKKRKIKRGGKAFRYEPVIDRI